MDPLPLESIPPPVPSKAPTYPRVDQDNPMWGSLRIEHRRRIEKIAHLEIVEGKSVPEIAKILGCSENGIFRTKRKDLYKWLVGEYRRSAFSGSPVPYVPVHGDPLDPEQARQRLQGIVDPAIERLREIASKPSEQWPVSAMGHYLRGIENILDRAGVARRTEVDQTVRIHLDQETIAALGRAETESIELKRSDWSWSRGKSSVQSVTERMPLPREGGDGEE